MKEINSTSNDSTSSITSTSPVLASMVTVLSTLSADTRNPQRCLLGSSWTREHFQTYPGASKLEVFALRVMTHR